MLLKGAFSIVFHNQADVTPRILFVLSVLVVSSVNISKPRKTDNTKYLSFTTSPLIYMGNFLDLHNAKHIPSPQHYSQVLCFTPSDQIQKY